jgi:hypothetical protein
VTRRAAHPRAARAARAALAWAALATALRAEPPDRGAGASGEARGFDHVGHEGRVYAAGQDPPACAACHPSDRRGRLGPAPGHDDCFGACHGPAPSARSRAADDRVAVCAACHDASSLTRPGRPRVGYPPYRRAPEFAIALSHRRHDPAAPCQTCHAPGGGGPPRSHDQCAACHDRTQPTMDACEGCHQRAFGPTQGPRSAASRYPVTGRFDHRRHERHLAARERPCLTCHTAAATADGEEVPRPAMTTCEPCHDGNAAFATLATECRRCHAWPDQPVPDPLPRGLRGFDHAAHRAVADCASCHALADDGSALPAGRGHQPCADAACHADDFRALTPVTCGVCHVGVEPWRGLHRHLSPPSGALELVFAHASHLATDAARSARPCRSCHRDRAGGLVVDGGHALCSGPSCHARAGASAQPALEACGGCHRPAVARPRGPWSVAATFRHVGHLRTAGGEPIACETCHARLGDGEPMPAPSKPRCAPCHDGLTAFKMTGHGCERCHGGG